MSFIFCLFIHPSIQPLSVYTEYFCVYLCTPLSVVNLAGSLPAAIRHRKRLLWAREEVAREAIPGWNSFVALVLHLVVVVVVVVVVVGSCTREGWTSRHQKSRDIERASSYGHRPRVPHDRESPFQISPENSNPNPNPNPLGSLFPLPKLYVLFYITL